MWELKSLNSNEILRCLNTISSHTFYMLVGNALSRKESLSIVRMADGEKLLLDLCNKNHDNEFIQPTEQFSAEWLKNFGVSDIPISTLKERLLSAAKNSDYFAASLAGIQFPQYNVDEFSPRGFYVDNFFPNQWDEPMKENLFKKAGHVLFIHRNLHTADAMQIRAKYALNVKVTYLALSHWSQADDVIKKAHKIDAPLVVYSAGPASKIIGPEIAKYGNIPKVTLDIGQAADRWTFSHLREKADKIRFNL